MNLFKSNRHSVRFRGYDYSDNGAYFVTVCTDHHRPFFGTIENDHMQPNWVGKIVQREWLRVTDIRPEIVLDEYVVMPNHFHAIVIITPSREPINETFERPTFGTPQPKSLAMIIGGFKSAVTRAVNAERTTKNQSPVLVWQKRFHDRIIRNEKELNDTRRYIIQNPQNWHKDKYSK